MIRKTAPVIIFFAIITVIGIVSKSIYFYSLPLAVTTDILTDSPIRYEYTVFGTVREPTAVREKVSMPFTGKIINIYVNEGQDVKTGDLLFSIDVSNLMEEINQIENLIKEREQRIALSNDQVLRERLRVQVELLNTRFSEKIDCLTHDIVFSPVDGIVSKVHRKNGDTTNAAYTVIEITVQTIKLRTYLPFTNNYRSFEVGETITLKDSRNQDCIGTIRNIAFNDNQKHIEVELEPSGLYKGEQLRFSDSFSTENIAHTIKTGTIRIDNEGYYILQLVKEKTSLGEKLFAKRVNICIGITVGEYTEIVDGITFIYPVIANSEIRDGMEIRVY